MNWLSVCSGFFCVILATTVSAQQTPIYPAQADVARIKSPWLFTCQTKGDYAIRVQKSDGSTELQTDFVSLTPDANKTCKFAGGKFDSWRISRGYLDLDLTYSWSVVAKNGTASSVMEFSTVRLGNFNFQNMPTNFVTKDASWKLEDGWLVNRSSRADTFAITNLKIGEYPGDKKRNASALRFGIDFAANIEITCPEHSCTPGIIFAAGTPTCDGSGNCSDQEWYEVGLKTNGESSVLHITRDLSGNYNSAELVSLNDTLDFSTPKVFRVTLFGAQVEIVDGDGNVVCLQMPLTSNLRNVGFHWKSNEDDTGKNVMKIDWMKLAASARFDAFCRAPLPKL